MKRRETTGESQVVLCKHSSLGCHGESPFLFQAGRKTLDNNKAIPVEIEMKTFSGIPWDASENRHFSFKQEGKTLDNNKAIPVEIEMMTFIGVPDAPD